MLTNTITAEKLDIPLSKIRRWTKEFLPPDPLATRRSGYTRKFTENDGFIVYVSGFLVSNLDFSFASARDIMKELSSWIYKIGLLPNIPSSAKRLGVDSKIQDYEVNFFPLEKNVGWSYYIVGVLKDTLLESKDTMGREYFKGQRDYVAYQISESTTYDYKSSRRIDKKLPISELLYNFLDRIKADQDEWEKDKRPHAIVAWHKKWDAIAAETHGGDEDTLGPPKEKS
jgi:hypothetical protein